MVQSVQKTIEFLPLQYIDKVVDVGLAGRAVLGAFVEETVELPQLRRLHGLLLPCPLLATTAALVQTSENCEVPQLQYVFVVDVPVVQVHLASSLGQGC